MIYLLIMIEIKSSLVIKLKFEASCLTLTNYCSTLIRRIAQYDYVIISRHNLLTTTRLTSEMAFSEISHQYIKAIKSIVIIRIVPVTISAE